MYSIYLNNFIENNFFFFLEIRYDSFYSFRLNIMNVKKTLTISIAESQARYKIYQKETIKIN